MAEVVNRDISLLNEVLDNILKGDMTSRIDLSSISKEYREIGGKINEMIEVTSENIGESKKVEEYASNLARSLPNPTSVMTPDGERIDTNLATERYFRRSRDEIIGKRVEGLYAEEDMETIKNAFEESKREGTGFSTCKATCLRGDGTTFPALLNFSPLKDAEGNIINVLVTATDITELRRSEEELRKLGAMVENVGTPIILTDPTSRWEYVNPSFEKVFGFTREEVLGKLGLETPMVTEEAKKIMTEKRELV